MKLSLKGSIIAMIAVASSASRVDTTLFEILEIQVACQGIDYDNLSSKALSFSAKALEDAFQTSHKDVKGLDLFHVSLSIPLFQSNNNLRRKESLTFTAKVPLTAGDLGGDDHGCRLCGSDEAAAQLVEADKLKVWESVFASSIASSSFDALKNAKKCNFKMFSNDADFDAELAEPFAADLNVQCENVNFAELPIKAVAYATRSLQETFDSVHNAVDGSKMTNIAMSGHRLRVGDLGGDDHGCRLCDEEVESWDIVTFTANGLTSGLEDLGGDDHGCRLCGDVLDAANEEMLKAWEGLFLARLLKESRGSFKDAKHCSISMKEKETTNMA